MTFKPSAPWQERAHPDPEREYVALATEFRPGRASFSDQQEAAEALARFRGFVPQVQAQLEATRGVIGYAFDGDPGVGWFVTLSVWEDERALGSFVRALPHLDAMGALRMGEGFAAVRWTLRGDAVPPTWDDAVRRLTTR